MADSMKYDRDFCNIVIPNDDSVWEENIKEKRFVNSKPVFQDYGDSFFRSLSFLSPF